MKTAVSLPDEVFSAADELASKQGWSRSKLYAEALTEYLGRHSKNAVLSRLNVLSDQLDTALDPALARTSLRTLERSEW